MLWTGCKIHSLLTPSYNQISSFIPRLALHWQQSRGLSMGCHHTTLDGFWNIKPIGRQSPFKNHLDCLKYFVSTWVFSLIFDSFILLLSVTSHKYEKKIIDTKKTPRGKKTKRFCNCQVSKKTKHIAHRPKPSGLECRIYVLIVVEVPSSNPGKDGELSWNQIVYFNTW